jgi:hypothetical protein
MSSKQTDLAFTFLVALLIILFGREVLGKQTNRHTAGTTWLSEVQKLDGQALFSEIAERAGDPRMRRIGVANPTDHVLLRGTAQTDRSEMVWRAAGSMLADGFSATVVFGA